MKKKIKVCLISNGGGHYEQLKQLKEVMKKYDCFYVVMKTGASKNAKERTRYIIENTNDNHILYFFKTIIVAIQSFIILLQEKPDFIISTGAGTTIPLCYIGKKIFRKKLIFIESFAKRKTPTKTGQFMYKVADYFIVQWEEMLKFYPNAILGGWIY